MEITSPNLFLPTLASELLKDAKQLYNENGKFSIEILQSLHLVYNDVLFKALQLVDTGQFTQYTLKSGLRSIYKITFKKQTFSLFDSINFCTCGFFQEEVLKRQSSLTCEHVLALDLAKITSVVCVKVVTDAQLTEVLRNNSNYMFE